MNILIAGAGPTGLTAAVELFRRGFAPRIIDRNDGPTPLSKAVGINAHSLDILAECGVTERLLAEGIRLDHMQLWRRDRPLARLDISLVPHKYNFLLALPQSRTEEILVERLEALGGAVARNTTLQSFTQGADGITVALSGPGGLEETHCDLLLGADGVDSLVRQGASIPFDGFVHPNTWSIADVRVAHWPCDPHAGNLFLHDGGAVGFAVPIGDNRQRFISTTDDAIGHVPGDYSVVEVLRQGTFHVPVKLARAYRDGGVFLAGDAAHVHSPAGALGMNDGIADAHEFARRLAEGSLHGYEAARRPRGQDTISFSERLLGAATLSNPLAVALRDALVPVLTRIAPLQRLMLRRVLNLD